MDKDHLDFLQWEKGLKSTKHQHNSNHVWLHMAILGILTKLLCDLKYNKEYRSETVELVKQGLRNKVLQIIQTVIIQFCSTVQSPVTDICIP